MLLTMHNSGYYIYIYLGIRDVSYYQERYSSLFVCFLNIEKENPDLPINHISSKELSTRTWMII